MSFVKRLRIASLIFIVIAALGLGFGIDGLVSRYPLISSFSAAIVFTVIGGLFAIIDFYLLIFAWLVPAVTRLQQEVTKNFVPRQVIVKTETAVPKETVNPQPVEEVFDFSSTKKNAAFCSYCGSAVKRGDIYCSHCGKKL